MSKSEVVAAEKSSQVVAVAGLEQISDDVLGEISGLEGVGLSDSVEDRGTPLLYIAQKNSRQVNKRAPEYIDGLEAGMAFNNLTGKFYDAEGDGVDVYVCFFKPVWIEWTPVDAGGGFHGIYDRDHEIARTGRQREGRSDIIDLPNGHELVLTHQYYAVLADSMQPIVIPMSSSNLKASQKLQNLIGERKAQTSSGRVVTLPAYFTKFKIKTVYSENEKGDWFRMVVQAAGPVEDPSVREFCKQFALACQRNEVDVAQPIDNTPLDSVVPDDDIPV